MIAEPMRTHLPYFKQLIADATRLACRDNRLSNTAEYHGLGIPYKPLGCERRGPVAFQERMAGYAFSSCEAAGIFAKRMMKEITQKSGAEEMNDLSHKIAIDLVNRIDSETFGALTSLVMRQTVIAETDAHPYAVGMKAMRTIREYGIKSKASCEIARSLGGAQP